MKAMNFVHNPPRRQVQTRPADYQRNTASGRTISILASRRERVGRRSPADGYCWNCCAGRSAGSGGGGLRTHTGCCANVWRRRYSGVLKLRPHVLHTTGCASWINRTCWRRLDALLYRRPHCAQRMPPAPAAPTPPAPPATPCPPAANNTRFALRHSAHSASRLPAAADPRPYLVHRTLRNLKLPHGYPRRRVTQNVCGTSYVETQIAVRGPLCESD